MSETQNIELEFTNNQHSSFSVILNQSKLGLQDLVFENLKSNISIHFYG